MNFSLMVNGGRFVVFLFQLVLAWSFHHSFTEPWTGEQKFFAYLFLLTSLVSCFYIGNPPNEPEEEMDIEY